MSMSQSNLAWDTAKEPDVAVSLFFLVTIDYSTPLGVFSSCEGLGIEVVVEQREEGGNNGFVHQLPGRMKYSNVKLTRPIDKDTVKVAEWFAKMNGVVKRQTAKIEVQSPDGRQVAHWTLDGVIPVKWSGPQMNVETAKVAMETLEIAHHGFLKA